jgi:hypothetical protein
MEIPKQFQQEVTPFIPLIASSLLNATYDRIAITHPHVNEAIFNREYNVVLKQWVDATMKLYENLVG